MRYWIDTEFIERGAAHPLRFLSIGIVAEDGRELYVEHPRAAELIAEDLVLFGDDWLTNNVLPHLRRTFGGVDVSASILAFCDQERYGKPEFWSYFADYDWVVLCQLFGRMVDLPKGWPMYCRDLKQLMDDRGVRRTELPLQAGDEHFALADARWNRAATQHVESLADWREFVHHQRDCDSRLCWRCGRSEDWSDSHGCEFSHTTEHAFAPKICSCGLARLTGLQSVRCPSCGWTFVSTEVAGWRDGLHCTQPGCDAPLEYIGRSS